jgi:integrase
MTRRAQHRSFGFVRERPGRPKPFVAGFNPPAGGKEVTKAFATMDEADVWLAEQYVSVARGAFVNPDGARTLFGDWWKVFLAERQLRPSSRQTYELHGKNHILPAFAHRPLGSLRRGEIQGWVNRLTVGPRTAQTVLAVLQSCLKAAVFDDLIAKSPAVGVRAPKAPRRTLVVPDPEEVASIASSMFGRYGVGVHLGAEAGLRLGEVLGLRVDDLDLLGRRVNVSRQAQSVRGEVLLDLPPKSDAGYRTVPLAPATVDVIAWHLKRYPSRRGLVITTTPGRPLRRNLFNDMWSKAKERAGVTRPLRFHDLRHRFASVLIEAGLDALTVKTLMGHSSIQETFDTYGHLFPSQSERAAKAIAAAIHAPSRTVPRTKRGEDAAHGT